MKHELDVENHVTSLVGELQNNGFETYIVGGAIRDLLLGRNPKDYDISTSATPEEVRACFGRRNSRIIGKRFRLVHVEYGGELFEVSTFRKAPQNHGKGNMITSDNDFGTAKEDATRRDFTVNALFYDPVKSELIDFTGQGIDDIRGKIVRAIGKPKLRFEEDPVRMLRALKLVGQYDFHIESETENALFSSLGLIRQASTSRLALELEKVLESVYGDKQLQAFHDFGLLHYFLPYLDERWGTPAMNYALELLLERNLRVSEKVYRNSVSLAMAVLALPMVEEAIHAEAASLWEPSPAVNQIIRQVVENIFKPQSMINRMLESAERILMLQPYLQHCEERDKVIASRSYLHALELFKIRSQVTETDISGQLKFWPRHSSEGKRRGGHRGGKKH